MLHKFKYNLLLIFSFLWYANLLPAIISSTLIIIFYYRGYFDLFTSSLLVGLNILMTLSLHIYSVIKDYEKEIILNIDIMNQIQKIFFKILGYFSILEVLSSSIFLLLDHGINILGLNLIWLSSSVILCNLIIYSILLKLLSLKINVKMSLYGYLITSFLLNYIFGTTTAYIAHDVLMIPKVLDLSIVTFLPIIIQFSFLIIILSSIFTDKAEKEYQDKINKIISDNQDRINSINNLLIETTMLKKGINPNNNYPIFIVENMPYVINKTKKEYIIYDSNLIEIKNEEIDKIIKYYEYILNQKTKLGLNIFNNIVIYLGDKANKDSLKILNKIRNNKNAYKNRTEIEKKLSYSDLEIQNILKRKKIIDRNLLIIKKAFLLYPSDMIFEEARIIIMEMNDFYFEWLEILKIRANLYDNYIDHVPIKYHDVKESVDKIISKLLSIDKELTFF